jgi:hypothetical protein
VKGETGLLTALLKARFFFGSAAAGEQSHESDGDCERRRDRARFRFV